MSELSLFDVPEPSPDPRVLPAPADTATSVAHTRDGHATAVFTTCVPCGATPVSLDLVPPRTGRGCLVTVRPPTLLGVGLAPVPTQSPSSAG